MPLPTFTSKTDNVDIIHAADVNNLQNEVAPTAAATPAARYSTAYTSTASITLTDASYPVQSVSPSAARVVTLPAVSTANHAFFVVNRSTANAITVNNAAAAFVAYVRPSGAGIILPDSTAGWYGISLPKFSTSTSPTNFLREDGTLTAVAESNVTFTDITTNNASTSAHGYLKKLSGTATEFMNGAGNWATPSGGSYTVDKNGCVMSNDGTDPTNDVGITAGGWWDSTKAVYISGTAMTKRLDANWAQGTGQGFRYSGAAIADTTYFVYLVAQAAGANPDYYADPSPTVATVLTHLQAETGGASYIYARRIGTIIRASGAILGFIQDGDRVNLKVPVLSSNVTNQSTSASSITLTVPIGIRTCALYVASMYDATATGTVAWLITDLSLTDTAPSASGPYTMYTAVLTSGAPAFSFESMQTFTSTAGQIRSRVTTQLADLTLQMTTNGWIDTRDS